MGSRLTLCPSCGSAEIGTDRIPHMGQKYTCPECDYEGSFVIEADSVDDAKRIRREIEADHEERKQARADEDADEEEDE